MSERCSAGVSGPGGWPSNCVNKGKIEVDGKWLCGVHSPEAVGRRRQKSKAKADAEAAAYKASHVFASRLSAAQEGVVKALSKIWGLGCDRRYGKRCALAVIIKPWCPSCIASKALKELEQAGGEG